MSFTMNETSNKILEQEFLDDERISLFMQGKMSADEESAFLDELKNNDELRERAIIQTRLIKGMKQVDEELKDAFRQTDERTIKRIANATVGHKKQSIRWLAIAASIVFAAFVGFKSYDYYDTTSLGKEYADTFPVSTIIRGEKDNDVEVELTTLFNKVSNGEDLDETTSRLAVLWEQAKQDTYNDYTDYAPHIGWNLAIAYLRNYDKSKAKCILDEMKKLYSKDMAIGSKVNELLDKF